MDILLKIVGKELLARTGVGLLVAAPTFLLTGLVAMVSSASPESALTLASAISATAGIVAAFLGPRRVRRIYKFLTDLGVLL